MQVFLLFFSETHFAVKSHCEQDSIDVNVTGLKFGKVLEVELMKKIDHCC